MFIYSCGDAPLEKTQTGPPSDPPSPGLQGDLLKYEAARNDSLRRLTKDSLTHYKEEVKKEARPLKDQLLGKWKWNKTVCCGRMAKTTLDSTHGMITIDFVDDETVKYYNGSQLTGTKVYRLGAMADRPTIRLEGNTNAAFISIDADMLVINYGYMDMETEYYTRVRQ